MFTTTPERVEWNPPSLSCLLERQNGPLTGPNSTVAREFEVALPAELSPADRRGLAVAFGQELAERHGCAVDVAIHAPGKEGDNRNHHAHILCTTRRLTPEGFGAKTRELDDQKTGEVTRWRGRWAELANEALERAGSTERVDHRSLKAQGIERDPVPHLGPAAVGFERRTGESSRKRQDFDQDAAERLARAKEAGELERQAVVVDRSILDLSGDLAAALEERHRLDAEKGKAAAARLPGQDGPFPELDDQALASEATRVFQGLPDPAGLAERRPDVAAARRLAAEKAQAEALARAAEAEARAAAHAWQDQHPMRAVLGMTGERDRLEQKADAHVAAADRLEKERQDATRTADKLAKAAQVEIKASQVAQRARLAELLQEDERRSKVKASQRNAAGQAVRDQFGGRISVRDALDQRSTERGPIVMELEHAIAQQTTRGLVVHLHSAFGGQSLPQLSEVVRIDYKAGRATWEPDRSFDLGKAMERGGRGR
jgi:ATP-dependent exoDNAse (exonuclease V) alpha subunit